MTRARYRLYLQSDHWKNLRARKIREKGSRCERCGSSVRIQIHHRSYERFPNCPLSDLEVLCRVCHRKEHGIKVDRKVITRAKTLLNQWLRLTGRRTM